MENNTDRELKDKLQSLDFPFDPKAWEQMESKLEENRKPKGFLWWWFGGVAASLLVVAGMYGYHQLGTRMNNHTADLASNNPLSYNNHNPSNPNPTITSNKPNTAGNATNPNPASNQVLHSNNHEPASNISTPINKNSHTNSIHPLNPSAIKPEPFATGLVAHSNKGITAKKSSADKQHKFGGQQKANSEKTTAKASKPNSSSTNNTQVSKSNSSLTLATTSTESHSTFTDPDGMIAMQANELTHVSDNADDNMKRREEGDVDLKKLNKKIFSYSLGASANITGSIAGSKTIAGSSEAFAHAPSYMAGFTHDFTFLNRFAITNSFLFSRTTFTIPEGYSSAITELAIPIGFKGYLVSKSKFRFYLGTGIINHIKLKETYTFPDLPNNYNTQTGAFTQASSANFVPNFYNGASELSINSVRRYYASFYASAGAEYIFQKHLILFAEPLFYMSLQKVGLSNYHQYNIGLSGGIRYQF